MRTFSLNGSRLLSGRSTNVDSRKMPSSGAYPDTPMLNGIE
jgi:hypothetical protein